MAWLPMYLTHKDVEVLNNILNQEEEIAFLVSNGNKKWLAKKQHTIINDIGNQNFGQVPDSSTKPDFVEYNLWHIPSGKLPLLNANMDDVKLKPTKEDWDKDGKVEDPWIGWTEIRAGENSRIPYFGAGHPGIIHLEIKLPQSDKHIPMSCFGWIGNHYKIIGNGADKSTEQFWNKLRRMIKKVSTHISRGNHPDGKKEVFAFPDAYKEIENGRSCSLNP